MNIGRLLLLMLLPASAFAQQQYYGTAASSVQVSAEADPADAERLPIRSGDTITPANVREAIEVLFSTGRYRSVDVDAVAVPNGTQLTFNVVPHYFFSTFSLDPPNILDRPLSSVVRLPVGQKFSESRLRDVIEQTERALEDLGYFEPTVTSTLGSDNTRHLRSVALRADVKTRAIVESVRIQGGEGVLTQTQISNALDIAAGDVFDAAELEKGLAAIQKMLLDRSFLNTPVNAEPVYNASTNTVRLEVQVDAGQETIIDTGGRIPEDEIRKLIPIFEEGQFDEDLVREGRTRIVEYEQQQGYFEATVEDPEIIPASAGNPLRINFRINPGERHKVRSIRFEGNSVFSDAELRERVKVRAAGFPGFLTHGLLSDQLVETDVQTIQNMYRRVGYEAAFVEAHRMDSANHQIDLVFEIFENQRYPVESIMISGNSELPESELRPLIRFKEGDFYSPEQTGDARTALMAHYYSQGFPDVHVEATADRDPETGARRINYQISEGRRFRVGSLYVTGNTRTAEKLIKRASGLKEYEFFNPEDILQAQQKLYATGLFTHVDVVPLDRDSGDLRTILVQVEEAKAIVVTPGIGVRDDTGPRVTLDISHNNILGGDRALGLRLRFGINERLVQTTYREPRLFNRESLDGFGTLTVERTEHRQFQAKRLELALQIRKRVTGTTNVVTTASYQRVDLKDFKYSAAGRRLPDLEGVIYIAKIGASLISDHRDNAVDPKRGLFNTSTLQFADKAWGSEVNFVSLAHQSSFFKPAGIGTLAVSSRIGWKLPYGEDDELPITERYFAGGSTTLRGFGLDEAGPPGGGQLLTLANLEYRIAFKKLSIGELGGALFYDTGNVFERPGDFSVRELTHSVGPGLRFQTPLGPVRFDIGFNLRPKLRVQANGETQRERRTHLFFTLGHAF
jgi:outer membrane protein insertion porin family